MGLFSDIVDRIKAWFKQNIEGWVKKWGKVVQNITQKIYKTINNVTKNITNVVKKTIQNITNNITNVVKNITNNIKNVTNNITKNITNVTKNIITNVTKVVGASTEWVNDKLAGMKSYVDQAVAGVDTVGFFKDPLGYIGAAFTKLIDAWVHGLVKSFGEGLQEGEQGSNPGPRGPGRSFMVGFQEALNEKES